MIQLTHATGRIKIILAIMLFFIFTNSRINSVTLSTLNINAISIYTFNITFIGSSPYSPVVLKLPSQVTILSNCTFSIGNGAAQNCVKTGNNQITISSSITTSQVSLIINNILNPNSAIKTNSFSYLNANQNHTISQLLIISQIKYQSGTFASCPWSFSLCAEAPNSELSITITTVNIIPLGNNYILIKYPSSWANLNIKGMITTGSSITCQYKINNGSFVSSSNCIYSTDTISLMINAESVLPGGTLLSVKILGVNSPPTQVTLASSDFSIATADIFINNIDQRSSCVINNVCVTSLSSMVQSLSSSTSSIVNGNYGDLKITYSSPIYSSFIASDRAEIYFNPFSSISGCTMKIHRGSNIQFTSISSGIYQISPLTRNIAYSNSLIVFIQCSTGFKMPPSQSSQTLTIVFKRNTYQYLRLTTSITAVAGVFNANNGRVSATTSQMAANSVYTFNFLIGQPLSSSSRLTIKFPNDFSVQSPICQITIIGYTILNSSWTQNGNLVQLIFSSNSSPEIVSGSNFTVIISGITNPLFPKNYSFQMVTYYKDTDSSSRVQFNQNAFSYLIKGINNYPITFQPAEMAVYSLIDTNITLNNVMILPSSTIFTIQYPQGTYSIALKTPALTANGSSVLISNSIINGRVVTFTTQASIAINSIVIIYINIRTPSSQKDYNYLRVNISNSGTVYISSENTIYLRVNSPSLMIASLQASNPTTGAVSNYTLTLTLTIPHDSNFIIEVEVPTDLSFISTGSRCSNCLNSAIHFDATKKIKFTANNSFPNTTSNLISYTIQSFNNPRNLGNSLPFIITTMTTDNRLISRQSAPIFISNPNILTAFLLKTEEYYRNNISPVKFSVTFTNNYETGDYLEIFLTSTSYSVNPSSSIVCANSIGICSLNSSTQDTTTLRIILNETNIINKSMIIIISGLKSGTIYGSASSSITLTLRTSADLIIDRGYIIYNLSCSDPIKNCKRCQSNGNCIECYLSEGQYLSGNACFRQCGPPTLYLSYANNVTGTCTLCINNCLTCKNDTYCESCINNYFLYTDSFTCKFRCEEDNGYFLAGSICNPCITGCLMCTTFGKTCTLCNSRTFLSGGECISSCGSTNVYSVNGICYPCDLSCLGCSGGGSSKCTACNFGFYQYLGSCVSQCPSGTAINVLTGNCSCHQSCIQCSNFTVCLSCSNTSYFVYNGNCIQRCPQYTYLFQRVCYPCSTGCENCTINTCLSCLSNNKLYNNNCYSDCNIISQQHDTDLTGTTCILCPDGCDRCSDVICTSCLAQYSLANHKCTKTCLLTNSCNIVPDVPLPMPGLLTLAVWAGIVIIVKLLLKHNYVPYSLIFMSSIIQLIIVFATISSLRSTLNKRLLVTDIQTKRQTILILLGISVAFNYVINIIFLGIFIKYFKPLIKAARQIDAISYVVMIIIATCTNFRFSFIAFARLFPKPYIYIQNKSKLTPIHYICLSNILIDIIAIVACSMAILNQESLTNTYMLSIDLLILILMNTGITIWFLASQKSDEYYKQPIVKYQTEDNIKNPTNETLPNQKDLSKHNIVVNESLNFGDDLDLSINNSNNPYIKFTDSKAFKVKSNNMKFNDENISQIKKQEKTNVNRFEQGDDFVKKAYDSQILDVNQEDIIPPKHKALISSSQNNHSKGFAKSVNSQDKINEDNISIKHKSKFNSFGKVQINNSSSKKVQNNIQQLEEHDDVESPPLNKNIKNKVFDHKQKVSRPKKINSEKKDNKMIKNVNINKKQIEPIRMMKKNKNGVYETDAFSSNTQGQDIQSIIKAKIWQSQNKFVNEKIQLHGQTNQQSGYEQISPSWFNIQNQRLDIQQLEQSQQP